MPEKPWIRTFQIVGAETTTTTFRTALVEHCTAIKARTFIHLGAANGCEARAIPHRGAKGALAAELRQDFFENARAAQEYLRLPNHEVQQLDVRKIDECGLGKFDVVLI